MFRRWRAGCLALALLGIAAHAADDRNPLAGDAKAAKAGEYEFRINCALCHGLGAHGGGRGPDLTRAVKKHTHSDADMFQVISNGIPGTAMPANGTNGQGVGMTDEEIWQIIAYIRSQEVKAPAKSPGQCFAGQESFLRRCELFALPHGRRQRRKARARFNGSGRIAHARGDDRVGARSKPPAGVGIDRSNQGISAGIRERHCSDARTEKKSRA